MKRNFLFRLCDKLIRVLAPYIKNDEFFIKLKFRHVMGYPLNLDDPRTFCEKIQWLKLNDKRIEYTDMVDKVEAKHFAERIIGKEYIIETLGVWDKFDEIDFDKLPKRFVLKCTHDSSKGIMVQDKSLLDRLKAKKRMEYFQKRDYYLWNREYPYKNVPHRILAETYLQNGNDPELMDYKFFCFNGRAKYCQVISNRSIDETIDFYDRSWQLQNFIGLNPKAHHAPIALKEPVNYRLMLSLADKLSVATNAPFVRIDLYNVNGAVYFGEITFFPNSGMGRFNPSDWDLKLGQMISL